MSGWIASTPRKIESPAGAGLQINISVGFTRELQNKSIQDLSEDANK